MESGREVEGPPQEFNRMTQKEYKDLLVNRDHREKKEAERIKREQELIEKRRARQIKNEAVFAKIQKDMGSMKVDVGRSMEQLYQKNGGEEVKITSSYRPSRLPIRNIKTADPKQRKGKEENKKRIMSGKIHKYDSM